MTEESPQSAECRSAIRAAVDKVGEHCGIKKPEQHAGLGTLMETLLEECIQERDAAEGAIAAMFNCDISRVKETIKQHDTLSSAGDLLQKLQELAK